MCACTLHKQVKEFLTGCIYAATCNSVQPLTPHEHAPANPRFVSVQSGKRGPDSQLTVLEQHVLRQELPAASIVMGNTLIDGQSADRAREKLDAQGRVRLLVPKGAIGQVPALLRALQMAQGGIKAGARRPWPSECALALVKLCWFHCTHQAVVFHTSAPRKLWRHRLHIV